MAAYPDRRGADERRRKLAANALGDLSDLFVAEDDGQVVAHAFLFSVSVYVGGRAVRAGAVASVAVAPEARGRGVAGELLAHVHRTSDVRGDAFTLLYAFRQGFYARHGYAPASSYKRLAVAPRAIPAAFERERETTHVRRARGRDRDGIERAHERAAARGTGMMKRSRALWDRLLADERRVLLVAEREGAILGYVAWSLSQSEPHAETRMLVHDLLADDEPTRRALLSAVRDQRDQVAELELAVAVDDPLDLALLDADARRFGTEDVEHTLGVVATGPMVRIEDVQRAIEARGYAGDGGLDVLVTGEDLATHVLVEGGRASAGPARGGPQIELDRATLSALLYGGVRASSAARLGWLAGDDAAVRKADALFGTPPFFAIDPF